MTANPQIIRYKKLIAYIDEHFKEDINIETVEEVCHYSYRNINRIFEALHHETIGKYIKRLRLEKAAQYLKYSSIGVSDIGFEVGFEDRAAFSKAFKNKYGCSPSVFRDSAEAQRAMLQQSLTPEEAAERSPLTYQIEHLPAFDFVGLEYRGDHQDYAAMEKTWNDLFAYTRKHGLVHDESLFMLEIMDDAEISDHIHSRYVHGLVLDANHTFAPEGAFTLKHHEAQKYARFAYQGIPEETEAFYHQLFAFWMTDVGLELADKPILEYYPNYEEQLAPEQLITQIYIPVE